MLPKKHRLSKHADVNTTTAKGRSFFSKSFVLKFAVSSKITTPLLTVIVSTKVSKSAVVRNRLKRIVRDQIHKALETIKPGAYVIIIKKSALLVTSAELRDELIKSLEKSKIIKNV